MKITDLVLREVSGEFPPHITEERNIHPLDAYPDYARKVYGKPAAAAGKIEHRAIFLEVRTDAGPTGLFGPIEDGHAPLLRRPIRDFVIGEDPLAIEKIWDVLLRWNRHSHTGHFMMAMSALDCALWDLKGKALGLPVYRLLNGPVREQAPAYASMLGFSVQPEALVARAREYQALGYTAQKWFFRYGPGDGNEGIARNVELARILRETLGEGGLFMLDAFHSWDTQYAVEVGRRIAPYLPAWLEEPVPSDRISAMRTIRELTGIPVATGEHIYTRWQVKALLEAGAADIIQADPDWCGGISELVKIAAVCSAYDVPLYPHGHSLHAALHVAAALPQSVLPAVEFLVYHQRNKQRFMKGYLEPKAGFVQPPETPGLGIELDPEKVQSSREIE